MNSKTLIKNNTIYNASFLSHKNLLDSNDIYLFIMTHELTLLLQWVSIVVPHFDFAVDDVQVHAR